MYHLHHFYHMTPDLRLLANEGRGMKNPRNTKVFKELMTEVLSHAHLPTVITSPKWNEKKQKGPLHQQSNLARGLRPNLDGMEEKNTYLFAISHPKRECCTTKDGTYTFGYSSIKILTSSSKMITISISIKTLIITHSNWNTDESSTHMLCA